MSQSVTVQEHYEFGEMPARIENALNEAGLGSGPLEWSTLTPLDHFHVRGLAATKELVEGLALTGGESVLDVGSGLGGPARYLAAVHGCRVTGIELTQAYVEIADQLSQRTGLSDLVSFVQGDALELPFPPNSFDHAWSQHVAMNIPDKERLYAGIYRVLKNGGRFASYDVVKGEVEPVIFPVPWARAASISFLASPAEMAQALRAAGFREVSSTDTTNLASSWFAELALAQRAPGLLSPLNLTRVIGPELKPMAENMARNIKEGRIRLMHVIVQKD
jgi:ubiquinone/menaquinone biosynthesis C-methylase UbiE